MRFDKKKCAGVTLVELFIVVAVISILAMVAMPVYQDTVVRSRRSDAMITLMRFANQAEIFYSNNNFYTSALGLSTASSEGYYQISFPVVTATNFTIRATPVAGGSQVGDGGLQITATGLQQWDKADDGSYTYSWDDH